MCQKHRSTNLLGKRKEATQEDIYMDNLSKNFWKERNAQQVTCHFQDSKIGHLLIKK